LAETNKRKSLIVIVGPTAVGKTSVAIELAKQFNTEIVSADSRQFYKEISIGTAKPSDEELLEVKHHFINSHSIQEVYSAGAFERDALSVLEEIFSRKDKAIAIGGSGLFIKALTEGLDILPTPEAGVREKWNNKLEECGISHLQEALQKIDPAYYKEVDKNNPQRLVRALEVYETTGVPFSEFRINKKNKRPFQIIPIALNMDRALLYERINSRVDLMMQEGLLKEVESVHLYKDIPALKTVGYQEIFEYLEGQIDLATAVDKIKQNTRRYAKRQITWFKKMDGVEFFHPENMQEILKHIKG